MTPIKLGFIPKRLSGRMAWHLWFTCFGYAVFYPVRWNFRMAIRNSHK